MLASYHRWVFENHRIEWVEVLREWVIQEADFQCRALVTVQGLTSYKLARGEARPRRYREPQRTFLGNFTLDPGAEPESKGQRSCRQVTWGVDMWTI